MKAILTILALAASATLLHAQPEGGPGGPPPGGPEGGGMRRPMPPVMVALDADKDGEISAEEIANAAAALKTLDKNNDGKLSKEELRPAGGPREGRPPREGGKGPDGAPRGPRRDGAPRGPRPGGE